MLVSEQYIDSIMHGATIKVNNKSCNLAVTFGFFAFHNAFKSDKVFLLCVFRFLNKACFVVLNIVVFVCLCV